MDSLTNLYALIEVSECAHLLRSMLLWWQTTLFICCCSRFLAPLYVSFFMIINTISSHESWNYYLHSALISSYGLGFQSPAIYVSSDTLMNTQWIEKKRITVINNSQIVTFRMIRCGCSEGVFFCENKRKICWLNDIASWFIWLLTDSIKINTPKFQTTNMAIFNR